MEKSNLTDVKFVYKIRVNGYQIRIGATFLKISGYFSIDLMISVYKSNFSPVPGSKWIVLESL